MKTKEGLPTIDTSPAALRALADSVIDDWVSRETSVALYNVLRAVAAEKEALIKECQRYFDEMGDIAASLKGPKT
jgi:hypothetical protein